MGYFGLHIYGACEYLNGFSSILSSPKALIGFFVYILCFCWLYRGSKWAWWALLLITLYNGGISAFNVYSFFRLEFAEGVGPKFIGIIGGMTVLLLSISVVLLLPPTRQFIFGKHTEEDVVEEVFG